MPVKDRPMPASTMIGRFDSSIRIWINSFVQIPLFEPIGAPRGMMQAAPAFARFSCHIEVRIHVRHYDKALLGKNLCSLYCLKVVRKQIFAVAHDFNFYEISTAQLAG